MPQNERNASKLAQIRFEMASNCKNILNESVSALQVGSTVTRSNKSQTYVHFNLGLDLEIANSGGL